MALRLAAVLLLLASPALAQPTKTAAAGTTPSPTASTPPTALTPAPMPSPLVSPDLQTQVRAPTLQQFVRRSAWQDHVVATARDQYKDFPDACPKAQFRPTGQTIVYVPPRFDQAGNLVQGLWNESVEVTGCPAPHVLNVLTVAEPGTPPGQTATMPGTTHADPATQKNALQYAQAVAIRAAQPGCRSQSFINTKFDGYTGLPIPGIPDGRENRAWRETWTLFSCGTMYDLTLTFTPNGQGTELLATNPIRRS